jgi:signal transduction histidine kinase
MVGRERNEVTASEHAGSGSAIARRTTWYAVWIALWPVGLAAGIALMVLTLRDERVAGHHVSAAMSVVVGSSFLFSGLLAWRVRRGGRIPALMVALGLLWTGGQLMILSSEPLLFTVGVWVTDAWVVPFAYFLLAFPGGRAFSRADGLLLAPFAVAAIPLQLLWLLFWDPGAPLNVLLSWNDPDVAAAIDWVQRIVYTIGSLALTAALALRWRAASPPLRRGLTPVLAGAVALVGATGNLLVAKITDQAPSEWLQIAVVAALIAVPIALLADMLRARLARSAVADLVLALHANPAPGDLRDAIARALGDPSLRLAYWLPEYGTFADLDGRPVELPADAARATKVVDGSGQAVAVLLHDPSLHGERARLDAVGAAAGLALERARLHAELHARVEELRGTRGRILEAAQSERRRLERDLHDGAQQRLVTLALDLRLLESRLGSDHEARQALEQARTELTLSLEELRELARGIHPAVVTGRGLAVALEGLIARAPVPVRLDVELDDRLPEPIEVAAYFLVSESLTNVAKYAHASGASVQVSRANGPLVIEVSDDGVGGASPDAGSGLRGLSERVAALGGSLEVTSPAGEGTLVHAELPCA